MVYQKLTRLLAPRIGLYFGVMLAFAGVTALLGETQAAVAELIVVGVLLIGGGWMMDTLQDYTREIFSLIAS